MFRVRGHATILEDKPYIEQFMVNFKLRQSFQELTFALDTSQEAQHVGASGSTGNDEDQKLWYGLW